MPSSLACLGLVGYPTCATEHEDKLPLSTVDLKCAGYQAHSWTSTACDREASQSRLFWFVRWKSATTFKQNVTPTLLACLFGALHIAQIALSRLRSVYRYVLTLWGMVRSSKHWPCCFRRKSPTKCRCHVLRSGVSCRLPHHFWQNSRTERWYDAWRSHGKACMGKDKGKTDKLPWIPACAIYAFSRTHWQRVYRHRLNGCLA